MTKEHYVVLPLLAFVVVSMSFLFAVSYTGATFSGTQKSLPNPFAPQNISVSFAKDIDVVGGNLAWSTVTAYRALKEPALAYLGIENYAYSTYNPVPAYMALGHQPVLYTNQKVLGAVYANPAYFGNQIYKYSQ